MKSLLDILKKEQDLITEINNIDQTIELFNDKYTMVLVTFPDCDLKQQDLNTISNHIDTLERDKELCEQRVRAVQRELKGYLASLSDLS